MLAVAVAAVLALGIPLGFVLGRLQVNDANQSLHHDAQGLANNLDQRNLAGLATDADYAAQLGRSFTGRYVIIRQDGKVLARTGVWPGSHDYLWSTVSMGGGDSGPLYEVTVETDD